MRVAAAQILYTEAWPLTCDTLIEATVQPSYVRPFDRLANAHAATLL